MRGKGTHSKSLPAALELKMLHRCGEPMWPEAWHRASWTWNWSTKLRKYLGRGTGGQAGERVSGAGSPEPLGAQQL